MINKYYLYQNGQWSGIQTKSIENKKAYITIKGEQERIDCVKHDGDRVRPLLELKCG